MNNKGSFKEGDSFGEKVKAFFKESGFYIAIVIGLCALAAGAVYFSTNQLLTEPEDMNPQVQDGGINDENPLSIIDPNDYLNDSNDQSAIVDNGSPNSDEGPLGLNDGEIASGINDETVADATNADSEKTAENDVSSKEPADSGKTDKPTSSNDTEKTVSASGTSEASIEDNEATADVVLAVVRPAFKAPLVGEIQLEFSMDKLVFSPTFNEWRTHSGVDISAPKGEVVRAVGNGKILEVKNDPRFGFTIVVDHGNGYKSLYANLASDQTMQIGQDVKMGDPIGAVGATAIFESAEATHLHFELYKEDMLVDPASYIDLGKKAENPSNN